MTDARLDLALEQGSERATARLSGALDSTTTRGAFEKLAPVFKDLKPLDLDLSEVSRIDSAGIALLAHALKVLGAGPTGCSLIRISEEVSESLRLSGWDYGASSVAPPPPGGFVERVGGDASRGGEGLYFFAYLLSEIFYQGVVAPFRGERPRFGLFVEQMALLGSGSAPIVLLVALLVGLTTAFQSAYELRQFGANIYVADLVAISMMIELGPLMAAILVAGRSGAAITAEIGTMKIAEEIDALKLIGIKPIQYLAVPRTYAVVITQALLGVTAAIVGIIGGLIIGVTYLDLSVTAFVVEAVSSLALGDLLHNLSKSMVFGLIIVVVGVFYGLRVEGGAEGVGRATTNSVVMSIFLIIVADCAFSFT